MRDINLRDAFRTVDDKFRSQFEACLKNLPDEGGQQLPKKLFIYVGIALLVLLLALGLAIFLK